MCAPGRCGSIKLRVIRSRHSASTSCCTRKWKPYQRACACVHPQEVHKLYRIADESWPLNRLMHTIPGEHIPCMYGQ